MQNLPNAEQNIGAAGGSAVVGQPVIEKVSGLEEPGVTESGGGENLKKDGQPEVKAGEKGESAEEVDAVKEAKEEINELTRRVGIALQEELKEAFYSELLQIEAGGGDVPSAIRERGQQMVQEGENAGKEGQPSLTEAEKLAKIALGYDIQIAAFQLEQKQLVEADEGVSQKKHNALVERNNEIIQEIKRLGKEKGEKVTIDVGNPLAEFAQVFGASGKDAHKAPLVVVSDRIEEAITDPKKRELLINSLRESEYFTEEQINSFEKFLKSEHWKEFAEKKGAKAAKIGGTIGLFALLMAWLAREKKQGGGMG